MKTKTKIIVMLDTPQDLLKCGDELGCNVEEFFSPLTGRTPKHPDRKFGIDNGSYSRFEERSFLALLKKHEPRRRLCRFVAVPDVVGCARRTIECFDYWQPKLSEWPVAFVAQDGQENFAIPWHRLDAIFIGGTTDWKMSKHASAIVKASRIMGKWCHVGRVNTPGRLEYFEQLGADSCDGTGLAQYTHMREKVWKHHNSPELGIH